MIIHGDWATVSTHTLVEKIRFGAWNRSKKLRARAEVLTGCELVEITDVNWCDILKLGVEIFLNRDHAYSPAAARGALARRSSHVNIMFYIY